MELKEAIGLVKQSMVGDKVNMKGILKRNLKQKLNEFRKEEEA